MNYSLDLRKRVLLFVAKGGSKAEAARVFNICRCTVYAWIALPADHQVRRPGRRVGEHRRWDMNALRAGVAQRPDRLLREWAEDFGVTKNTISVALKQMGITRKKNAALRPKPAAKV
jgi:transposase